MSNLTSTQRDRIIDDLLTHKTSEHFVRNNAYTDDNKQDDEQYLQNLSDTDLVEFWYSIVGDLITELAEHEESDFHTAWNNADIDGVSTATDWQFQKLLNGDELDFTRPQLSDLLEELFDSGATISFAMGAKSYLLGAIDLSLDDDNFVTTENGAYKQPYSYNTDTETFHPRTTFPNNAQSTPDRIHIDDIAGVIHETHSPTGHDELLYEEPSEMHALISTSKLTEDLTKAGKPDYPVFTFTELHSAYTWEVEYTSTDPD